MRCHARQRAARSPDPETASPRAAPDRASVPGVAAPRLPAHDISRVPIADVSGRSATAQLRAARPHAAAAYRAPDRTGLPDGLKAGIEARSGRSAAALRAHHDLPKPARIDARHLPHEASHVGQQQDRARLQDARAVALPMHGAVTPAPVQRRIDPDSLVKQTEPEWGIDATFRKELINKVDLYNEREDREDHSLINTHRNLAALDEIEHSIYRWFDENKTDVDNKNRVGLFRLLDDVQDNHKYWVAANVEQKHPMWTSNDEALDEQERKRIDDIWDRIAYGGGAFKFKNRVHTATENYKQLPESALKEFKEEVFATLARLYSRPKGRELLEALDEGYADQKKISFVMSPIYKILGTEGYAENRYVGAKAAAKHEDDAMVKLKELEQKNLQVVRGKGSGAGVEIAPGIKDAGMMDFDAAGNPILSPRFIGVGHELVHAAHYGAGTYIGQKLLKPHATIPGEYNDDVEELLTIASQQERAAARDVDVSSDRLSVHAKPHVFKMSEWEELNKDIPTEADIREEHGLSIRSGHTTTANPYLYPGAKKGEDPGQYVKDAIEWIRPYLDKIEEEKEKKEKEEKEEEDSTCRIC